jgi:hypothetical protein
MPRSRARRPSSLLTSLAFTIGLAGLACDDPAGPESRVVAGVDLDVLFAPPTDVEIAAISADWASRSPAATDWTIHLDTLVTRGALDLRVRIVSHDVEGIRHYGAVFTDSELTGPAPILVYAHGGDDGESIDDVLFTLPFLGAAATELVWVVPSFRGEALSLGAQSWTSDGPPSPWDRDVDDALSLIDVALEIEPVADAERIGVLGFSRGAAVGMLMGIRDERIDRVVEFFGPTDFFETFVQDVVEEALRGTPRSLPGLAYLDATFLQPLARGELDMAEVRRELVRRSIVLYAERLPRLQLHHGRSDAVVHVGQAESLIATMQTLGRAEPEFEAYLYTGGTHNPLSLEGGVARAVSFLEALLEG